MRIHRQNRILIATLAAVLGVLTIAGAGPLAAGADPAPRGGVAGPGATWSKVRVELPASRVAFPPGGAAIIANGYCLICHSAGMVLKQPPLTQDEWTAEINKMRKVFGASLPDDQVAALAQYLHAIDGR